MFLCKYYDTSLAYEIIKKLETFFCCNYVGFCKQTKARLFKTSKIANSKLIGFETRERNIQKLKSTFSYQKQVKGLRFFLNAFLIALEAYSECCQTPKEQS